MTAYPNPFRKSRTPKWVRQALAKESELRAMAQATERLKAAYLRDLEVNGRVS